MSTSQTTDAYQLSRIPVSLVRANPMQVRRFFDEDEIAGLAASIREVGLLQPVLVTKDEDGYCLIAGERRLRAARLAGLDEIPALVRSGSGRELARLEAALENIQRSNLSPMEVAAAYQDLLEELDCSSDDLAARLGVSYQSVRHHLRLFAMPPGVQTRLSAGTITLGHAKVLMGLLDKPGSELIERLADRVVAEGLTVRQLAEQVLLVNSLPAYGGEEKRKTRGRPPAARDHQSARELEDALDTQVTVTAGRRRGTISIRFSDEADLARIMALLLPARGHRQAF